MNVRLQSRDEGEPQSGRAFDAVPTESDMIVGDLQHAADTQLTATPGRRLRNWLLIANVLAWILIVVVLRWLFF
jgi:hypothetical protein